MAYPISETEFKKKAPMLFKKLKERAKSLKETEEVVDEIVKLADEAESAFQKGNLKASMEKYNNAQRKISLRIQPLVKSLFRIEIGYLSFLLLLGYLTYKWPHFILWNGLINLHLQASWFGALGGVTIAIYGIYSHVQARDFDPEYRLWYWCKPIMGGIFGWFIFILYYVGLVSVQGIKDVKIQIPEFPMAISFLAGFSERFTIKMIDKLMAVLTTWSEQPPDATAEEETKK